MYHPYEKSYNLCSSPLMNQKQCWLCSQLVQWSFLGRRDKESDATLHTLSQTLFTNNIQIFMNPKKLTNNPKSGLQFPKRTQPHISTVWPLFSLGEQTIEAVHCLSNRKHLSTLSNTFNVFFSLQSYFIATPFHSSSKTPLHHCSFSLMAPQGSRTYKLHGLQLALTLTFFLFLIVLLPHSGNRNSPFNPCNKSRVIWSWFYIFRNIKLEIHHWFSYMFFFFFLIDVWTCLFFIKSFDSSE